MTADPIAELRRAVCATSGALRGSDSGSPVEPRLERPKRPELGDFSTNAGMLLAPVLDAPPRVIAERLGEALAQRLGDALAGWEVAGPGFLNLRLADGWFRGAVAQMLLAGDRFGGGGAADRAERILIEFVSANPTGPLVAASGRHAVTVMGEDPGQ